MAIDQTKGAEKQGAPRQITPKTDRNDGNDTKDAPRLGKGCQGSAGGVAPQGTTQAEDAKSEE
eukprot:2451248-Rhodomonas_salina.1